MQELHILFSVGRSVEKIGLARERYRAHDGTPHFEIRFGKAGTEYRVSGVTHRHQ